MDQILNSSNRRESRENPGIIDLPKTLGYMPNRGDFDNDYDNELEQVLAEIEYFPEDTP